MRKLIHLGIALLTAGGLAFGTASAVAQSSVQACTFTPPICADGYCKNKCIALGWDDGFCDEPQNCCVCVVV